MGIRDFFDDNHFYIMHQHVNVVKNTDILYFSLQLLTRNSTTVSIIKALSNLNNLSIK